MELKELLCAGSSALAPSLRQEFLLAVTKLPQEEQIRLWKELQKDGIIQP